MMRGYRRSTSPALAQNWPQNSLLITRLQVNPVTRKSQFETGNSSNLAIRDFSFLSKISSGVGIDTASIDAGVAGAFPVHFTLEANNKYGLENLCCLDKVPESGGFCIYFCL